jgi:DNA-directed RNA polymerase specialized sigma24 family protein
MDNEPRVDRDNAVELIRAIEPRLRRYLRCIRAAPDELDSLVADVVAELWCSLPPEVSLELFGELAVKALRGVARTHQRRRRHEVASRGDGTVHSDVERQAARNAYRLAIDGWWESTACHLTASQRLALELYVMDDRADVQIATKLGCSTGSVRVLRHKAKGLVRALVAAGVVATPPGSSDG